MKKRVYKYYQNGLPNFVIGTSNSDAWKNIPSKCDNLINEEKWFGSNVILHELSEEEIRDKLIELSEGILTAEGAIHNLQTKINNDTLERSRLSTIFSAVQMINDEEPY